MGKQFRVTFDSSTEEAAWFLHRFQIRAKLPRGRLLDLTGIYKTLQWELKKDSGNCNHRKGKIYTHKYEYQKKSKETQGHIAGGCGGGY